MQRLHRFLALVVSLGVALGALPATAASQASPAAIVPAAPAHADSARRIFESMARLEKEFDVKVIDLYCDSGMIFLIQVRPGGGRRSIDIPARQFKDIVLSTMARARAQGDYSTYSNARYSREGSNVRVSATRYSEVEKASNDHSLLVGPCNGGAWKILEERAEFRLRYR